MRVLDEPYTRTPVDGVRRMTAGLKPPGEAVHHHRVARLLPTMGLEPRAAKPRTSLPPLGPRVSPSWRRGVPVPRGTQVWRTDLTSIRRRSGLGSLGAGRDGCSRDVVSWAVARPREGRFCRDALEQALCRAQPAVFHRDHGVQFTSTACTSRVEAAGRRRRREGRGRALDTVFVERRWRTVNDEEVYGHDDEPPREATRA